MVREANEGMNVVSYRPLPSSSLVQCCSHVVEMGFDEPTGVVVVVVVLVVSS